MAGTLDLVDSFAIVPVPPFRLDFTAWAIRRRAHNLVDLWDGMAYHRAALIGDSIVELEVRQVGPTLAPTLKIRVWGDTGTRVPRGEVRGQVEKILGTSINLTGFYRIAREDPQLWVLTKRFRGMKPPRFPSVYEALVNGIACQQLSLIVGIMLLNRLALACSLTSAGGAWHGHPFPRPQDVIQMGEGGLKDIGFSKMKARALLGLSEMVLNGDLDLSRLEHLSSSEVVKELDALPGIGRWTAEYVLLRGLPPLDVFPGDDVGARNRLRRFLNRHKPMDYDDVARVTKRWQPYAGVVYFHLLLLGLTEAGIL
jgi:DNA-3-methyladenine glycosylase II